MDLSTLSDEDLLALQAGDLSKVSDEGLASLQEKPAGLPDAQAKVIDAGEGFKRRAAISATRAENPVLAGALDFFGGATGLTRGGLNAITSGSDKLRERFETPERTVSSLITGPEAPTEKVGLGDRLLPTEGVDADSGLNLIGSFADPVAWATGANMARLIPYKKVFGAGVKEGAKALGQNVAGGAATGAAIGALSDEGDAASGAAIGAVANTTIPPVLGKIGKVVGKVATSLDVKERAAAILRKIAGNDIGAIRAATANAPAGLTAAQSASGVNNDVFNALDSLARMSDLDSYFARLDARQKQSVIDGLTKIAGGANQTEAQQVTQRSQRALQNVTGPMRETSLNVANASAATGLPPLDTGKITASIRRKIGDPELGVSDINRKVLAAVGKKIDDWTAEGGGVIDAKALYEIRKSTLNEAVERLMRGADPKAQSKRAAQLLVEVKPLIDDAIEASGGTGWRNYLSTFEQGSRQIDRQRMGAKALDLYEKSPSTLESLAAGNEPNIVRKVTKGNEFDLSEVMGAQEQPIQRAASELARDRTISESAARGTGGLTRILGEHAARFRLPNWINAKIAVTNRALAEVEGRVNKKTMEALYQAMRSGADANDLLSVVPVAERSTVIRALINTEKSPKTRAFMAGFIAAQAREEQQ